MHVCGLEARNTGGLRSSFFLTPGMATALRADEEQSPATRTGEGSAPISKLS